MTSGDDPTVRGIGPLLSPGAWWPPRLVSEFSAWNEHIPFAGWIVEAAGPHVLVELGTHTGVSYFAFCESVLRLGLGTQCYAVDTWLGDRHSGFYGEEIYREVQRINSLYYVSFSRLLRTAFDEALGDVPDSSIDLLHIDGLHTYEAIKHDFESWLPKLTRQAVVLLHDTNERKDDFGVHRLFAELTQRYPTFAFTHGHGLGVVCVGEDAPPRVRRLIEVGHDSAQAVEIRQAYAALGARFTYQVANKVLRSQLEGFETDLAASQETIVSLEERLAAANATAKQHQTDLAAKLQEVRAESARALEELRERAEMQRSQLQAVQRELREGRKKERELAERLEWARAQVGRLQQQVEVLRRQKERVETKLQRLTQRKSVRLALRLASLLGSALRTWNSKLGPASQQEESRPSNRSAEDEGVITEGPQLRTEAELAAGLRHLRPNLGSAEGPLVSIVVLTRNGRPHLERLLVGLRDRTRYRSFELLVVDNASTDGTDLMLREDWGFPIRIIRNEENTSFSEGNNQGIAQARGDLILLLNNDVDPINEGWLGAMVEGLRSESKTLAVGALLVYPRRKKGQRDPDQTDLDLTVQHRGIAFVWEAGAPRAVNLGRGEDPLNPDLVGMRVVPAVTAACLLVSKQKLTGVGGLTEGYVFGTEDVDLCLKLRDLGGEILYCGQAALFHHEFGSQETIASELKRAARLGNACRFRERWTPRLARSMRIDQLTRGGRWTEPGPRVVGITVTRDDPKDGFGDWYTAHGLGAALAKLGWKVWYLERHNDNWRELPDRLDLLVSLLPQFDPSWAPEGCFTIAWVRNWVDRWLENPAFSGFDLVVAATEAFARRVAAATEHEPIILPLAADPGLFRPTEPVPALHCDYTFTANRWGGDRPILNHLDVDPDETFLLFGKGWEEIPRVARYWRGFLDYQQLPLLYSSTKIVVDDTVPPNKPALNGRVFEALASGALVITDNVEGSEEVFGGRLPTYRSRQELRYQLDRYLGDGALREATAEELRGVVLADHTYEIRAQRFIERSRSQLLKPKVAIKIGPPDQVVAERWGDTHFARAFAKALRALDFSTQIHILPEWDAPQLQDCDVVVHLRGLTPYVPKLGHLNVLWIISHPADVTPRECERFDLVLVASETFAEELREQIDTPVHVLHQATDPDRFREVPADPDLRCRVLFVGNSRRQVRPAVQWAIEQGAPLHLYGAEWEDLIDSSYVKGPYFPNERLNELYCSAEIVLNDHWPDMAESGFVSNRIYDALACGAFIITDPVDGLEDLFEETVPTFSNKEELQELLERYGKDPEERQRLSALGRQIVVSRHSFQVRAREFVEIIRQSLGQRSLTMEVPARAEGSNAP